MTEIFIPKMGANIEKVIIGKILVKKGDSVNKGDILFEIVTDKATFDVEAEATGTILELNVQEGDELDVVTVVGQIGDASESTKKSVDTTKPVSIPVETTSKKIEQEINLETPQATNTLIKATPKARKFAKENNIDLEKVFAGIDKIIKEEDIEAVLNTGQKIEKIIEEKNVEETVETKLTIDTGSEDYMVVEVTPRKAAEIQILQQTQEYLYSSVTIQLPTKKIRKIIHKIAQKYKIRLSLNAYLYFCVASVLPDFPDINAVYTEKGIKRYKDVNLGIAMNPESGLIVPVIKKANTLKLAYFLSAIDELIMKMIKNEFIADDFKNGTFTITDLSSYNVHTFIPIINKDQSSILAIGSEYDSVLFKNNRLQYDPKINVTLAFDHRVLDGKYASQFLQNLYEALLDSTL